MTPQTRPQVAVIGLGRMGTGMAHRLRDHGYPLAVWNRTAAAAEPLVTRGATAADTPLAAAKDRDLVLVSLADADATRQVLYGPDGVLSAGPLPGVLLSTSTLSPEESARLADHTAQVLEVGLVGNHRHAAEGQLRLLVGGPEQLLERVRPTLETLSRQVRHVGPLGAAMRLKALLNLLMGVQVQALAEAVALGGRLGLDRELVLDAVGDSGFASPVMNFKAGRLRSGDYTAPDFRLRLMAKDLRLALSSADPGGPEAPVAQTALRTHDTAVAAGHGDADCAAVAYAVGAGDGSRS